MGIELVQFCIFLTEIDPGWIFPVTAHCARVCIPPFFSGQFNCLVALQVARMEESSISWLAVENSFKPIQSDHSSGLESQTIHIHAPLPSTCMTCL
jgi:hypothetical protein